MLPTITLNMLVLKANIISKRKKRKIPLLLLTIFNKILTALLVFILNSSSKIRIK